MKPNDYVNAHRNCGNCMKRVRFGRVTCRTHISDGCQLSSVCNGHRLSMQAWKELKRQEIESRNK